MKLRMLTLVLLIGLLVSLFGPVKPVEAASYGTAFVSSIVYMNVSSDPNGAEVTFDFYAAGSSTPVTYPATGTVHLAKFAAGSLYAGDVFSTTSFKGSLVISSSQMLAVTGVSTPPKGSPVKVRMMSNGFSAGAPKMTVQSVRRTSAQASIFSVQNADASPADITVKFFPVGATSPVATDTISNLPAGSSKYYDMGTNPLPAVTTGTLPNPFDGSVTVEAVVHGTTTPGSVVAASTEYDLGAANYKAYAFSAVATGASTVYMPSAFCNYNQGKPGAGPINTFYAIANASDAPINIAVNYSSGKTDTFNNVAPGAKISSNGCAVPSITKTEPIYSGSATIVATWTGTPGTGSPAVVTVGKVVGYGYSTAFEGVPQPGPVSVALPYVRYATGTNFDNGNRQRVFIAVQNVGTTTWDATHQVTITFYDQNGVAKGSVTGPTGTNTVTPGNKISFDAHTIDANFGYWATSIGGGAVVTAPAGSAIAVLARAQTFDSSNGFLWSEDYMGIPMP